MILKALGFLFRRGMENPSTPMSDPDEWTIESFGGGKTLSGQRVNSETALNYSPVWRAVNMIARDVAKLPLFVFRRVDEGLERAPRHPATLILHRQANEFMTAFQFKMRLQADALLWGNGYAMIMRNGGNRPMELLPLKPDLTEPALRKDNGSLNYITRIGDEQVSLDADEVLHIRGLGDGYRGKSVLQVARESFGIGLAAQSYAARFYANHARPSAVIEHPEHLSGDAMKHLKTSWQDTYGGSANFGKVAILEEGMKLHPFSMSHEDAQFLETRQFEIREIANWFGVPPHKLGDTTRTAFASLEQENQSYLDDALDGWLCNWEAELYDKLLSDREKAADSHTIEFVRQALVRTNLKDRGEFYNLAVQGGWMSRNEIRARENLNPIPGTEGDQFLVPLNMAPAGEEQSEEPGEAGEPPVAPRAAPAPASRPEVEEPLRVLLADVTRRMTRRIVTHARKAARKPDAFIPWLEDELTAEHRPAILEAAAPVVDSLRAVLGLGEQATAEAYTELLIKSASEQLFSATDYPPSELGKRVEAITDKLEGLLIPLVVERFFNGNGRSGHEN